MNIAPVVIIPQNYEELSHSERSQIIPICIRAFDRHGQRIAQEWFSLGVAPIRKELVGLASYALGDPWCGSELAEAAVHRLWVRHGHSVGVHPERRVMKKAIRIAEVLKSGDWKKGKYPSLFLALESMDEKVRDQTLPDPNEYAVQFEREIMLNSIADRLEREGREAGTGARRRRVCAVQIHFFAFTTLYNEFQQNSTRVNISQHVPTVSTIHNKIQH